jgi:hypothetical protein
MAKPNMLKMSCTIQDGWGYVEFSKRAAYETQELIRDCIHEQSKFGYGMATVHRLSRMYMELDKSTNLEMLSREDLDCLRKCLPTVEIENQMNWFYRANFFKPDQGKFKEASQICKSMFSIHEE